MQINSGIDPPSISLHSLREIDPYEFEHFVADLWRERHYVATVRQQSNDKGIDIVARRQGPGGVTEAIQVKRYSEINDIGRPEIQQYFAMRHQIGADRNVIVTTGRFNNKAKELAEELGFLLIDGKDLRQLIHQYASLKFYQRYDDELGIAGPELERFISDFESRSVSDRLIATGNSISGQLEIAIGRAIRGTGRTIENVSAQLRTWRTKLRGFDPILTAEKTDEETSEVSGIPWDTWQTKGSQLVERGNSRQDPNFVNWKLDGREALPLSGVNPTVRRKQLLHRGQWPLATLGAVLSIFVIFGAVGGKRGIISPQIVHNLVWVAIFTTAIGILWPAISFSRTPRELYRVTYAVPVFVGLPFSYTQMTIEVMISIGIIGVLTSGAFLVHTGVRQRSMDSPPYLNLSTAKSRYVPALSTSTTLGLLGCTLLVSRFGLLLIWEPIMSHTVMTSRLPIGLESMLIWIGLFLVITASVAKMLSGGLIGLLAMLTATGGIYTVAGQLELLPYTGRIGLDIMLLIMLLSISLFVVIFDWSKHRAVPMSDALSAMLGIVVIGQGYLCARLLGLAQPVATIGAETILGGITLVGLLLYGTTTIL
ncbi:MAG: restriction endonuclease, partial [Halobacteriaceae archaeon]